jgi:Kdo2-lipid IVA lauroyltransferase/acyltransferase
LAKSKSKIIVRGEYLLLASIVSAMRRLPSPLANGLARLTSGLLDKAVPKLRRTALVNLGFAYPDLSPADLNRIVDGVFRTLSRLLYSFARLPDINSANVRQWIRYEGLEHYQAAKQKGNGILVATAHLGNWELSAFTHAIMTEPMGVMIRPLDNPLIDDLVERRRQLSGNQLISKKDAALTVLRALKRNQAVGILIDQNTTPAEGVFIDFFGRKACANAAFARLAARTGATVIPGFAFWHEDEKKYVLRFYPEVPMSGDVVADTQRIHAEIEKTIRQYPDQWMWIHRRWKTRPEGETAIY